MVFLDMNMFLKNSSVMTSLFSKPLNLYLYIPPVSCHPKGVINGLVFGHFIRVHILCCESKTILKETILFTNHLLERGYTFEDLSSLLDAANQNAINYAKKFFSSSSAISNKANQDNKSVFFHLTFHPSHPNKEIKQAWKSLVANPTGKKPLKNLITSSGFPLPVNRFIMCYHKAKHLNSLLSYRKLSNRKGPKVSSFWDLT